MAAGSDMAEMEMPTDAGDGTIPEDMGDGETPNKPDGEGTGGETAEMPEGEAAGAIEMPTEGGESAIRMGEGEVPDMPDGDEAEGGEAPDEIPSGDMAEPDGDLSEMGDNMEMPSDMGGDMTDMIEPETAILTIGDESVIEISTEEGEAEAGSLEDITEGVMLSITFDDEGMITSIIVSQSASMGDAAMSGGMGDGMSASGVDSYTSVTEYTEDATIDGEDITSAGTDENAILVSGAAMVTIRNTTVNRVSSDSTGGDNSSFYGVGAAILGINGTTCITDSEITTDSAGGAGVFAYGDGVVYVANTTITTSQNTSGGIHAAGGGTLYAWQLTVNTAGESAAAIRSDRGGGTMVIDGGTYTSSGLGSPALYCTADIAVNDATLTATGSEAICMEGLNSIHLFDCDISGSMVDQSQNDTTWNIIVYQSMSGDSEVGNSTMQIIGGSITANNGGMFYTTNTECNILLSGVDFTYADDNLFFLMVTGNANERGWGTTGSNGSQCTFTTIDQEMVGNIIWDSVSTLDFYMTGGSTLTGAIVDDETYAGNGGDGYCSLYISEDSTWIVTGDSTVTNLYCQGTIVDAAGNTVSVVGNDGTVYVSGTGSYTITVDTYAETADFSGAAEAASWADYEVEMPTALQ